MPKKNKKHKGHSSRDITESIKALLVGINYRGTTNELGGCINDVLTTQKKILAEYPNASIELITDDTQVKPTRNNILTKLKSLIDNAQAGDTIMFHYSGHGSQRKDFEGDEEDGMDETICPIDFMQPMNITVNGFSYQVDSQITDDEIHEIISHTPKGVQFLMLSDSCHSGTIGDLKNDCDHSALLDGTEEAPPNSSAGPNNPLEQPTEQVVLSTVNCNTAWVYSKYSNEFWLTPLESPMYDKCGGKFLVIKALDQVPAQLTDNPNKVLTFNTLFTQLANGQYKVSSNELRVSDLLASFPQKNLVQQNKVQRSLAFESTLHEPKYTYDPDTGNHHHFLGGKKRTLNMKSRAACNGGELRIISGCQEDQTSADIGIGGACSCAFWMVVDNIGGLHKLFPKLFSHHIEDLKNIQDSINWNLSRSGFSQHSVLSWDHASAATRTLGLTKQQTYIPLYASSHLGSPSGGYVDYSRRLSDSPSGGHVDYSRRLSDSLSSKIVDYSRSYPDYLSKDKPVASSQPPDVHSSRLFY